MVQTKDQILGNSLLIVNLLSSSILMASSSSEEPKRSYDVMDSSSSKKPGRSYDVFLSFRGPDVRSHFIGHLYTALVQAGISTYIDDEELKKGEQISPALMKAIEESRIAIVVFSENYASSAWCLEELTKIIECKEQLGLTVFPVFYKVEPRDVRGQKQRYGQAMGAHEVKFGEDSDQVKRWKKALSDTGYSAGWHFTDAYGYEAVLIQEIVRTILNQLNQMQFCVAKYMVGIRSRVQELSTILNLQSTDDVLMVGLWGQGGVGKTTLAQNIYNDIYRDFQGASFLERIREKSKDSDGLVHLQEQLLSELLRVKEPQTYNVGRGRQSIKDRLCNKKVLIILDDIDDACQLEALAEEREWFGEGSRIIITTRNKDLLTSHGVNPNHIYEVKVLEEDEALELLKKYACLGNQEIEISINLVRQVLHYASGLPLALKVLGASLCNSGEDEWKSTLRKLAEIPYGKINDVLKVSYDGLDPFAKEIFLHIACFFKGRSTEYIKKVLDSCDFDTTSEIKVLIKRCLISEEEENIQMHDLIQLMGMDIVKGEDRDDPTRRSRLWLHGDVLNVLSEDKETKAVKAIVLQLPKPEDMYIGPNAFTKMKNLKLLILLNVDNSFQGPIHLPNGLRWFEWPYCSSTLKFSRGPKELVGLDMRNGEAVPKQLKELKKLKHINFHNCQSLVCMPDISNNPKLKELDLSECENLERVHGSVANHDNLQLLNFNGCPELHHFPNVLRSKNLLLLDLGDCPKLQRFPDIPDKINGLRELCLVWTSIEELPASIENLVSLEEAYLDNCKKLAILPSSIYRLNKLETLSLSGCSKLTKFPKMEEELSDPHMKTGFSKLKGLYLDKCNLLEAEFLENPACFPELYSLDVSYCQKLKEIPRIPRQLNRLSAKSCKSLSKFPSNISHISHVQYLYLDSCHGLLSSGLTVDHLFNPKHFNPREHFSPTEFLLPGGEMPQWLLPNEDGYISFTASKNLYKKFIALAIYVVCRREKRIECFNLWLHAFVNGKTKMDFMTSITSSLVDHVCLRIYELPKLWGRLEDAFGGADDRSQFHLMIRAAGVGGIVQKCGFRLLCKPLKNDLKVLAEDDQLRDLVYETENEDYQTSIDEEEDGICKAEWKEEFTVEKWRYSLIPHDFRIVCPGGEMPEEFVIVEDRTISFVASQNFYAKFRGLALCVVVGVEGGEKEISFNIVPHIHSQRRNVLSGTLGSFDSDHVWIQYLKSDVLWGVLEGGVDFGQFNERDLQFSVELKVLGGTVKRLGYMLRCTPLDNDLKVMLENNPSVNPAVLYQDCDGFPDVIGVNFVRRFREINRKPEMSSLGMS